MNGDLYVCIETREHNTSEFIVDTEYHRIQYWQCIDGVCVADRYGKDTKYLTIGAGQCVDKMGKRMPAQQGISIPNSLDGHFPDSWNLLKFEF